MHRATVRVAAAIGMSLILYGCSQNAPARKIAAQTKAPANTQDEREPVLHLNLSLEGGHIRKIRITTQEKRLLVETPPGHIDLDLSMLTAGEKFVFFACDGYAPRWISIDRLPEIRSGEPLQVELFRERFVVIRYAFNPLGGGNLAGNAVQEGRAAVAHWGSLEFFGQDWQVWQHGEQQMFGDTLYLDFHRQSSDFGFAEPPGGQSFDDLKEAPATGYRCVKMKAQKGMLLYCRVNGNSAKGTGYGKILIESVTDRPPPGLPVLRSPGH